MNGIHTKSVDVKFIEPHQRILPIEISNAITPRVVKIYRPSPTGFIFFCEVWSVLAEVISFWALMVVDHIENYSDPLNVCFVHQAFKSLHSTIRVLNCEWINPIVSPISRSRKLSNRHDLN